MKLVKIVKCKSCGETLGRNSVHCLSVMINGCAAHFCLIPCWQDHARIHDQEWQAMPEAVKDAIIQERHDNG